MRNCPEVHPPELDWDQVYSYLLAYLAGVFLLQKRRDASFYFVALALLFFLAFAGLTKNTSLVLAAGAVVAVTLQKATERNFGAALGFASFFLLSLVTAWAVAGQELSNLPGFIRGIFVFSSGYNEAVMFQEDRATTVIALVILCLLLARSLYNFLALKLGVGRLLIETSILFIVWKHGLVRADFFHLALFYFTASFFAMAFFFMETGAAVDSFGSFPGYVLLNRLNYSPRPMLEQANEAFYRNRQTAPRYVMLRLSTVPPRSVMQDDALAARALLDNYHPVGVEGGECVLLEKNSGVWRQPEKKLLWETGLQFGQDIALDNPSHELFWMEVQIEPSFLGGLSSVFYKPPACLIRLRFAGKKDGLVASFITSMGTCGCLVSPYVDTTTGFAWLYSEDERSNLKWVEGLAFGCDPAARKFFKNTIKFRLYSIPKPAIQP